MMAYRWFLDCSGIAAQENVLLEKELQVNGQTKLKKSITIGKKILSELPEDKEIYTDISENSITIGSSKVKQ